MSQEAFKTTIAEMREHGNTFAWECVITYGYNGPYFTQDVRRVTLADLADRIEAATARLREENERLKSELEWSDKQRAIAKSFHDVAVAERDSERRSVDMLRDEVKRLKAALKPVLEVEWPTGISGGIDTQLLEPLTCICDAVRSAQLIYNGGAE